MAYFPIFLDLEDSTCLVVGGGQVGYRKIATLLQYGANIHLVSRTVIPALQDLIEQGSISWIDKDFHETQVKGMALVIAATSDRDINIRVKNAAKVHHVPVNIVDVPELCSFIMPSIIREGDLTIAISTGGRSPALAKQLRKKLRAQIGPEYAVLLTIMGKVREKQLAKCQDSTINQKRFEALVNNSDLFASIKQNNWASCEQILMNVMGPDFTFKNLGLKME